MSFQKVPAEILEQILNHLQSDKTTLGNCLTVCKSWNILARQLYFEILNISVNPETFLRCLVAQPPEKNIGIWVKKLTFEYDNKKLPPYEYVQLLSYLPNLKEIDLRWSYSTYHHLILLPDGINYLKNLEKITADTNLFSTEEFKLYFACVYSFRHTIKHLDFTHLLNNVYEIDGRTGKFSYFLKDFPNLQSISLKSTSDQDGGDPNLTMFPILQSCPNLINFALENEFQEPEVDNYFMESATGIQRMNQYTQSHLKLKTFDLRLPNFTKSHIQYILSYFPTQLNRFKLNVWSTESGRWFEQNELVIDKFGKYLGNVEEVDLAVLNYNPDRATPLLHKSVHRLLSFAGSIMGEYKKLNCHVSVKIVDLQRRPLLNNNFRIKRNQRNVYLEYTVDKANFSNTIQAAIPLQYHEKLALNDKIINSIDISATEYNLTIPASLEILESILTAYPRVESIIFSCNFYHDKEYRLKFGSIPSDCELKSHRGYQCSARHDEIMRKPVKTHTKDNLKYVLIHNATLDPSDLTTIARLLPTTIVVKLLECDIKMDQNYNMVIDLQELHNSLKQLVIEIKTFIDSHCEYVVLQVEEMAAEARISYYYWKAKSDSEIKFEGSFLPTNYKFLEQDNRIASSDIRVVFIKCQKIEEIVCLWRDKPKAALHPASTS